MPIQQAVTLQEALDIVEALPEYQQEDLIQILQRRRLEHRRDMLAKRVEEARAEYARGEVTRGSVEELMKELTA